MELEPETPHPLENTALFHRFLLHSLGLGLRLARAPAQLGEASTRDLVSSFQHCSMEYPVPPLDKHQSVASLNQKGDPISEG
jgi:hypothetical protein